MAITREEVRHVAALARLRLEPAEEERLAADLDRILEAFARLRALDAAHVAPTTCVEDFGAPLRDDVITSPPADEGLLAVAPAREGRLFRVPRILE